MNNQTGSKNTLRYILMALGSYVIFGFSFLFSKLALQVAEPYVLLAIRFFTAFGLMSLLRLTGLVSCRLKGKDIRPLLVLGLLQPVLYFLCESYGIKYTSSSFSGTIVALIPIVGVLLAWPLLRERPTVVQFAFSVLSVAGVLLMTVTGRVSGFAWKGFLLLLGAVFSAAFFTILSRGISDRFSSFERTYVMFLVGTVFFFAMAFFRTRGNPALWVTPMRSGIFWLSILYLAGISSVAAFLLLNRALDGLEVSRTLVFTNITTVISVLAGVVLLKERFSALQAVGICMVILGVYGVNRAPKKTK